MSKKNIAIIFAGGTGTRMNSLDNVPKQFLLIEGKPIIIHTIELFERHSMITDIVVVCLESRITELSNLLHKYDIHKVSSVIPGGCNTQMSILNGLCEAERLTAGEDAVVLIHDGVRPLITSQTITDNINSVLQHGSCITCAPVTETIIVTTPSELQIPKRNNMHVIRAPQSFLLSNILSIHRQAYNDELTNFTDCSEMMLYYGKSMKFIMGPAENLKITTPNDYYMCEALLKKISKHEN